MIVVIIPARYQSTRFSGKPLANICGKPMIQHVYENVLGTNGIGGFYVATDDQRIYDCVKKFGGEVLMTSSEHTCGTERLAECAEIISLNDDDIVLNVQGDEPLITTDALRDLINTFDDALVYMSTLKKLITKANEIDNPNVVKVVTDINDDAIYFSRYSIPYNRNGSALSYYKHIGIYGYKVWFLKQYVQMHKSTLEITESLEQLRVLENGFKIRIKETAYQTLGVDTPEQLKEAEQMIRLRDKT